MSPQNEPLNLELLTAYFASGEKPKADFRIGTEHEKFGFEIPTRAPLAFPGRKGIEQLFKAILADAQSRSPGLWRPLTENGSIIGLASGGMSISLEPAGQLELSGAPLPTIHDTAQEVTEHLSSFDSFAAPTTLAFWPRATTRSTNGPSCRTFRKRVTTSCANTCLPRANGAWR